MHSTETIHMESMTLASTNTELGDSKFERNQIVVEKFCHPTKRIPFKIKEVIKPKPTAGGYYHKSYEYIIEVFFKEDSDAFMHGKSIPEFCLTDFESAKSEMIGALISKAQDIKEMRNEG